MAILGYARVSTTIETVDVQVRELESAGAERVFHEVGMAPAAAGQLQEALAALGKGDVLLVTRFHRLARSTHDLHKILASIDDKGAGFRSLGEAWADTTAPHGRALLMVLAGVVEFEQG